MDKKCPECGEMFMLSEDGLLRAISHSFDKHVEPKFKSLEAENRHLKISREDSDRRCHERGERIKELEKEIKSLK